MMCLSLSWDFITRNYVDMVCLSMSWDFIVRNSVDMVCRSLSRDFITRNSIDVVRERLSWNVIVEIYFDIICILVASRSQRLLNYLFFKYFERTWWRWPKKRVVNTKYDMYMYLSSEIVLRNIMLSVDKAIILRLHCRIFCRCGFFFCFFFISKLYYPNCINKI